MRVWGRVNINGTLIWQEVTTDANGFNDAVYLTALIQALKLNLGESPFYANYGIPAYQTVMTQVFPDYYMMQTQSQYAGYFSSLTVARVQGGFDPQYNIKATTHYGSIIEATIPA
ncbi:MAG: hypothetical protein KGI54_18750 [Pseudomonadota bacterium]|nr:hypothetical protein [Pseudomonadota bacterium]